MWRVDQSPLSRMPPTREGRMLSSGTLFFSSHVFTYPIVLDSAGVLVVLQGLSLVVHVGSKLCSI